MKLNYNCPKCGTPLGYEGLCWKCKAEKERQEALAWTVEEIAAKQRALMDNLEALEEFEDPEYTYFCNLLEYHDGITPAIQRKALEQEIYWPSELYYHAPEDVGEELCARLLRTESSREAANLMCCAAMQGGDKVFRTMLELDGSPRPWRKGLYVGAAGYAETGGWTFDGEGNRIDLNFGICYPMVKGVEGEESPVRIGRLRDDTCPHCGGRMADMLVLDGRDERLKFLGIDGILTAACCPNCVGFLEDGPFNRYTLDGGSEIIPSQLMKGLGKWKNYMRDEDYAMLQNNNLVLGKNPVPLFYGAFSEDVDTVGGFANWVQDAEYTRCPDCGRPMKYLAQIQWATVADCMEGTLYIEFCPGCRIVSMRHQQT